MKLKKYLQSLLREPSSNESKPQHKRKTAIPALPTGRFWNRFLRILTIKFIALLVGILFFTFFTVSFAQAPIHSLIAQITKPKPITQSSKVLPSDVQQAIVDQAKQEIKQEQANALLATGNSNSGSTTITVSSQTQQGISLIQNVVDTITQVTTSDPSVKAKLKIKGIDNLIVQLQNLLTQDRSDGAIDQAVSILKNIGDQTSQIAIDPKVQTDREVIALQIEQYNRLQLKLQKLEEQLPINAYLKIEGARQKYVVVTATASLNAAPNLDIVHNIAIKQVASIVGTDYAELKSIEILTDLQNGLTPSAQQKLTGLQKQLALQFEKRMVALPADVRTRKLQNFIQLSYGNPLNQTEAFEQMKSFLTDREMILSVDSLKELALQKLENRVFEIKNQPTLNQFLDLSFRSPQDLKILTLMESDVLASGSDQQKKQIADLEKKSLDKVTKVLGQVNQVQAFFGQNADQTADILDVALTTQLTNTLQGSSKVSPDVKTVIADIKQKTLQQFVTNAQTQGFATSPKRIYNPVSKTADVRLLLSSPQAISLFEAIKKDVPPTAVSVITLAEKIESSIVADHLLRQVNDPTIFDKYKQYIADTPLVKQTIENTVSKDVLSSLNTKEALLQKQAQASDQQLYEKTQQIVQAIFVAGNKANIEAALPSAIQTQITQIKQELPNNAVPKLTTPSDVILPAIATLPNDVQNALINAAKAQIKDKQLSSQITNDITVEAKDLGVSVPIILPDNPLYLVVEVARGVALLTKADSVDKAKELIKQDNEKTLEAEKLVEQSQSTTSIDTAIKTLGSVKHDFEKLQANVDQVKSVEQTASVKVDSLVNEVIADGVIRQTIISSIENKIHGDEYVAVEKIRQDILKNGVDTLLAITDNNVQKLTDTLETVISQNTTTPIATVTNSIKAIDLLNEIARTEPESAQKILQTGETTIATSLEKTLLSQPADTRAKEISLVVQEATGNPVRQFEALDVIKDDFKNPSTILLTEALKNKVTDNLTDRISEISDAPTQNTFTDIVIGNKPQDLKAVTAIASEIAPPQNAGVVEIPPIVQQVNAVKAEIVQNIVDTYKDKPQELAKTDFFTNNPTPDVIDIKVAKEIVNALSNSSSVTQEVMQIAKQEETKIIATFVANISKPEFQVTLSTNTQASVQTPSQNTQVIPSTQSPTTAPDQTNVSALAAETLNGSPDTITTLLDLKAQTPAAEQTKIDAAIKTEITIIKDDLTNQTSPTIAQAAVAQITENPVVAKAVEQASGKEIVQAVEQKAQDVQQQTNKNAAQLQATVIEIQKEVFSAPVSNPSPVEQTLPQSVQQEIQQIKHDVPAEQTPQVVAAVQTKETVTIATQPVDTTPPATQPTAPTTPEPQPAQTQTPTPSAPSTTAPVENKPAPAAAPAAPAVESKPVESAPAPAAPAAPGI